MLGDRFFAITYFVHDSTVTVIGSEVTVHAVPTEPLHSTLKVTEKKV